MLTLNDGRTELWQWDTGRNLTVDADCSQVHFSNKVFGRSIDVDVVDGTAAIPDVLLQVDNELIALAFVGTPENGYTKISKVFKVNKRNKPADYVFTPPEQTTLGQIMKRLDRIEESQDPDAIKNAVDDYLANNPIQIDEKDPTVPAWAKQATKPKYTAKEVGAVASSELSGEVNDALAKAKASGEFDGKSAYEYARDCGYAGTEAEFAAKLAEEMPSTIPNPHALTINGQIYDGSEAVELIIEGGASTFVINVSGDETAGYAIDKTVDEIAAAYEAGSLPLCKYGDAIIPFVRRVPRTAAAGYDNWYFMAVTDDATATKVYIKAMYLNSAIKNTNVTLTTTNYLVDDGQGYGLFIFQVTDDTGNGYTLTSQSGDALAIADIFGALMNGRNLLCFLTVTGTTAAVPFVGMFNDLLVFGATADIGDVIQNITVLVGGENTVEVNMSNLSGGSVDIPEKLPNPEPLVINGVEYDGSATVDMTAKINALIDTKLGVIENGTY